MRTLSALMKTLGLWAVLAGYFSENIGDWNRILIALGLILMISAWYLLDFSYYRAKKEKDTTIRRRYEHNTDGRRT